MSRPCHSVHPVGASVTERIAARSALRPWHYRRHLPCASFSRADEGAFILGAFSVT